MRFPNLSWALAFGRIPQYRLAAVLVMSEASLSRRLAGRADFLPHEKRRIAEYLAYREDWLFREENPPASARLELTGAAL